MSQQPENFWTYSIGGDEYFDAEFKTKDDAEKDADERFNDQCAEGDESTENQEIDVEYIRFSWNDETGERVIHDRVEDTLFYEYYHGDYAEHNTHYRGGCL